MREETDTVTRNKRERREARGGTSVALLVFGIMLLSTGLLNTLFALKTGISTGTLNYAITAMGAALILAGKKL